MSLLERFKLEDQEMERFSLNQVFIPHKDSPKKLDKAIKCESSKLISDNVELEEPTSTSNS
ncbi:hypothetical protein [Bacteriovorax sp. Seq25_V]|uniref:hypothetical protein n=1 Tax=Bacteriovorax sp. Seq25_V TaxID=1201288 RepID=UPI000389DF08|nr:hypothetical protein [Bacteriovorax sp. Seq25_V]EQC43963.1 hypothetical protein M900_1337 [Bacteriovorax sp. Seq25_V]